MNETVDSVPELQQTVQRKLGRCMLRLQQYELLLKAVVAESEISGPADRLLAIRDERRASTHKQTLGALVSQLTEGALSRSSMAEREPADDVSPDRAWFSMRYQIELPEQQFSDTHAALKELVALRNELVHHFLQRFDLWDPAGCEAAEQHLDGSYETIDGHYLTLHTWARSLGEARTEMASFMQSQAFHEVLVNGIWLDGSVHWPSSGVVSCLREAERLLACDGWTVLSEAIRWITKTYPDQTPKRYGCSSWRHVLHEAKLFDVRKEVQVDAGGAVVWYRSPVAH
ncbi:OST-HTH/LOTUS domain-containing protein [Aquipseudomonas alcaligenes]|uniref:HTH OST-type domain-containing protein n=1 Tax=Aquipseudomonas alcaligenes (strain ATCC 14909 / DSM 50342 / CCUG 1425 / JCM 20561 / NBRC 14159 / NCIMB 9945 / NCTC 10367 / 1577) TaxID=1215092 RepID=U2Z4Q2_AQUA1|nr:OST-HTH/LOTUS domain-containing protein [Pseudomonas alcaligenes]GAD62731.1 hypothetical protein PA6_016_00030 [Pseudomonas alcaligenes NBRC 14159]SUD20130.1 OST-HTH/LOTUS domain [Pseudomonas alcaligenes]